MAHLTNISFPSPLIRGPSEPIPQDFFPSPERLVSGVSQPAALCSRQTVRRVDSLNLTSLACSLSPSLLSSPLSPLSSLLSPHFSPLSSSRRQQNSRALCWSLCEGGAMIDPAIVCILPFNRNIPLNTSCSALWTVCVCLCVCVCVRVCV